MVSLDIFHADPFTAIELTTAVDKIPYNPSLLRDMDLFEPKPVRTDGIWIEERDGQLLLVPTSPKGTPPPLERTTETRAARYFKTSRLAHGDTIYAHELQNIRAFGTEAELMEAQAEVARRLSGPTGLLANLDYTEEHMMLGAVQGVVYDADNATVIYNFFNEFEISQAASVPFSLASQTANSIRPIVNQIYRTMARASRGAFRPDTRIVALCGDTFYDEFVNHPDVIRTFLNWSDAQDIRQGTAGAAFDSFPFAGVDWVNYRGSDDVDATIGISSSGVRFFPKNAPGVFQHVMSPADRMEFVGELGRPRYVYPIIDMQRNQWWRMEAYSFPLFICTRPEVLMTGTA